MNPRRRILRLRRPSSGRADAAAHDAIDALIAALRGQASLEALLGRRVRMTVDSGGAASLPAGVVTGRAPTADVLRDLLGRFADPRPAAAEVNGSPGILIRSHERVVGVLTVHVRRGRVAELWAVVNPDKLGHWAAM